MFNENKLKIDSIIVIASWLKENKILKKIHFNDIDYEGAKAIAQALTYNNTLTTLSIRYHIGKGWNNIGDEGRTYLEKSKSKKLRINYYASY